MAGVKLLLILAALCIGAAILRADDKPLTLAQARAEYDAADAELNKAYAAALAELDVSAAARLREDESDWISYRDQVTAVDFSSDGAAPHGSADYWDELAGYEQDRAAFLRAYSGKRVPPGISGEYTDSYGATLKIQKTKNGVLFYLSAVRGPGHNQGEISGVIAIDGDAASFKQSFDAGQDGPPCELAFKFTGAHIVEIDERVPDSTAGFNVHYGGDYYKIGDLKKGEDLSSD
jgi:uncharacterized protein YecT (DUF1311 family)